MTSAPQPVPQPVPPQPAFQPGAPVPAPTRPSNGLATAGFVLGLLGFLGSFIPVVNIGGIVLGVLGVILAAIGLVKAKALGGAGKGLAVTGIVLGALAVIIAIVINVVVVGAVSDAIDDATKPTVGATRSTTPDDETAASDQTPAGDETPTDDETPADDAGTSRDNPVALGTAISADDWTVTVNSVKEIQKDKYGQKAAKGKVLLAVNLTATYTGDDKQGDMAWATVRFVTADGTTIDSTDGSTLFIADHDFDRTKEVYEGASVKGDELIEVPADGWEDGVLAVSPAVFSDDTFVAVK